MDDEEWQIKMIFSTSSTNDADPVGSALVQHFLLLFLLKEEKKFTPKQAQIYSTT